MSVIPDTRHSLIGKLHNPGDVEAWHEFATLYHPLILRIAQKQGLQHADAADVAQEVLARVASAIHRFDATRPNATFRGWLHRITKNLVIDFIRAKAKQAVMIESWDPATEAENPAAEENGFELEYRKQVFWLVARQVRSQVQESTWQAFWLTEIEGRPAALVANQLSLSVGAVYIARSRVLARLKSESTKRLSHDSLGE